MSAADNPRVLPKTQAEIVTDNKAREEESLRALNPTPLPDVRDIVKLTDAGNNSIYAAKHLLWTTLNDADNPLTFEDTKAALLNHRGLEKNRLFQPVLDICKTSATVGFELEMPRFAEHAIAILEGEFGITLLQKETAIAARHPLNLIHLFELLQKAGCAPLQAADDRMPLSAERVFGPHSFHDLHQHIGINDDGLYKSHEFRNIPRTWTRSRGSRPEVLRQVDLKANVERVAQSGAGTPSLTANDDWVQFYAAGAGTGFGYVQAGHSLFLQVLVGHVNLYLLSPVEEGGHAMLHQLGPYHAPARARKLALRVYDAIVLPPGTAYAIYASETALLQGSFVYTIPTFAASIRHLTRILTGQVHEHSLTTRRNFTHLCLILGSMRRTPLLNPAKIDIAAALGHMFSALHYSDKSGNGSTQEAEKDGGKKEQQEKLTRAEPFIAQRFFDESGRVWRQISDFIVVAAELYDQMG